MSSSVREVEWSGVERRGDVDAMPPEPPIRDIRFDEIGSYPLPKGVRREDISLDEPYLDMVEDALLQKISAGVEIPNYPQFRDMSEMFLDAPEELEEHLAHVPELGVVGDGEARPQLVHCGG
ncbi:hypothetical protein KAW64_09660, partial [bacterium]|nr:hypothetical protein [bacterium]